MARNLLMHSLRPHVSPNPLLAAQHPPTSGFGLPPPPSLFGLPTAGIATPLMQTTLLPPQSMQRPPAIGALMQQQQQMASHHMQPPPSALSVAASVAGSMGVAPSAPTIVQRQDDGTVTYRMTIPPSQPRITVARAGLPATSSSGGGATSTSDWSATVDAFLKSTNGKQAKNSACSSTMTILLAFSRHKQRQPQTTRALSLTLCIITLAQLLVVHILWQLLGRQRLAIRPLIFALAVAASLASSYASARHANEWRRRRWRRRRWQRRFASTIAPRTRASSWRPRDASTPFAACRSAQEYARVCRSDGPRSRIFAQIGGAKTRTRRIQSTQASSRGAAARQQQQFAQRRNEERELRIALTTRRRRRSSLSSRLNVDHTQRTRSRS